MTPIPTHLQRHDWYAPHLAWLRGLGRATRHDPGAAEPRRADIANAGLRYADLRHADLRGAFLRYADLRHADLRGAFLRHADLRYADLRHADLRGAFIQGADLQDGMVLALATPEEEAATLAVCIDAIRADRKHWDQERWHGTGYDAATASEVGACGTAHCLAGWCQALLPLDDPRRRLPAETVGALMLPQAHAAGWFEPDPHPDLVALVEADHG